MENMDSDQHNEALLQSEEASARGPISSALEDILTNPDLSYFQRLRQASWCEIKTLFYLAAPAVGNYLLSNITAVATLIFCGQLGNLEFAGASLGNTGVAVFAYGLMVIFVISNVHVYLLFHIFMHKFCDPRIIILIDNTCNIYA